MACFEARPFNDLADLCPNIITPLLYAGLVESAIFQVPFIFLLLIIALRRAVIDLVTPTIARMPHRFLPPYWSQQVGERLNSALNVFACLLLGQVSKNPSAFTRRALRSV